MTDATALPWSAPYDVPAGDELIRQPGFDATWRILRASKRTPAEIALAWQVTYDVLDAMGVPAGTHKHPVRDARGK